MTVYLGLCGSIRLYLTVSLTDLRFLSICFMLQDGEAKQRVLWTGEDARVLYIYVETLTKLWKT